MASAYMPMRGLPATASPATASSVAVFMGPATKAGPATKVVLSKKRFWRGREEAAPEEEDPPPAKAKFALPTFETNPFENIRLVNPLASEPEVPEPVALIEEEEVIETRAAAAVPPSLLTQIGEALVGAVGTLIELAVSRVQLAFLRQVTSARNAVDQTVADLKAVPANSLAAAKRALYLMPFYAKATIQLAAEDLSTAAAALQADVSSRVQAAPGQAKASIESAVEQAQASAAEAFASAKAAPEQLLQSVTASVQGELNAAQAQADELLAKARSVRDSKP